MTPATGTDSARLAPAARAAGSTPWLPLALGWALLVLLAATQEVVRTHTGPEAPVSWPTALLFQLPFWGPLAVVAPLLFAFVRRVPFDRRRRWRSVGLQVLAFVVASLVLVLLSAAGAVWVEGRTLSGASLLGAVGARLVRMLHLNLFMVGAVLAVAHAVEGARRLRARELQASRLRAQLSEARLSTLSAQLRPHFLFNTLHSISSLLDEDPKKAQEMVAALSDLLRDSLREDGSQRVPLREELRSVELYLAIERIRFQDRLRVRKTVAPEALGALVPALLLQPLVENAVRHGIARRQDSGVLELRGTVDGGELCLQIADDGAGLAAAAGATTLDTSRGVGLHNARERLAQLYGDAARLELRSRQPHGAVAEIRLPFEPADLPIVPAEEPEESEEPEEPEKEFAS